MPLNDDGFNNKPPASSFSSSHDRDHDESLNTPPSRVFRPMISLLSNSNNNTQRMIESSSNNFNNSPSGFMNEKALMNNNFHLHHQQHSSDHFCLKHVNNKLDVPSPTTTLRRQHVGSSPKRNRTMVPSTPENKASPISIHSNSPFTPLASPPRSITCAASTNVLSSTFHMLKSTPVASSASRVESVSICMTPSLSSSQNLFQQKLEPNTISHHHHSHQSATTDNSTNIVAFLFMYSSKDSLQNFERAFPLWSGRTLISRKNQEYFLAAQNNRKRMKDVLPPYDRCICINSPSISKIHALIEISEGEFSFLEDLNSRNRTVIVEKSEKKKRHINIQSRRLYQLRDDNFILLGNIICKFKLCTEMDETMKNLALNSHLKLNENACTRKSPKQLPVPPQNGSSKLLFRPPSATFPSPSKKTLLMNKKINNGVVSAVTTSPTEKKSSEILVPATPEMTNSSQTHNTNDTLDKQAISSCRNDSSNNIIKELHKPENNNQTRHFVPPTNFVLKKKSMSNTDEKEQTCQKVLVFETPVKSLENGTKSTDGVTIFQTPSSSSSYGTPQTTNESTTMKNFSDTKVLLSNDHQYNNEDLCKDEDLIDLQLDDIDLSFLSSQQEMTQQKQPQQQNPEPSTSTFNISNSSQFDDIEEEELDDQEESQANQSLYNNPKKRVNEEDTLLNEHDHEGIVSTAEPLNDARRSKKKKYKKSDHQHPHILFTGIQPTEANLRAIERLGGVLIEDAYTELLESRLTHLITDKLRRTVKFLCALGSCPNIVTIDWLEQSTKTKYFIDEEGFYLHDVEGEEKFNISLIEVLNRRDRAPHKLFHGMAFFLTSNILPKPDEMKLIIECNGGSVLSTLSSLKCELGMNKNVFVITCEKDYKYCTSTLSPIFEDFDLNCVEHFFNSEFVMASVVRQEIINNELTQFESMQKTSIKSKRK